jgi:hypothetical protein
MVGDDQARCGKQPKQGFGLELQGFRDADQKDQRRLAAIVLDS